MVTLTTEDEINCDQCLSHIAQFAERELAGKSSSEALTAVEHHLSICVECREEYEVLRQALSDMADNI